MDDILVPVSPGELIDKLTILALKAERISDPAKRKNVLHEQSALQAIVDARVKVDADLRRLWDELHAVNARLWEIEDDIRICERESDFGDRFIVLARAVYVTNDDRAAIKKAINLHLGSRIVEEKSYEDHGGGHGNGG